jgi:multidrug resistance efflux pump
MLNLSRNKIRDVVPMDRLYSLRALQSPYTSRALAHWIIAMGLLFLVLMFLPWQQNINGTGQVTALSPAHRPQMVPTLIAGRVLEWKIQEGQYVNKGDTIVVIGEIKEKYFDPQLLMRLREQIDAKEEVLSFKGQKAKALSRQLDAIKDNLKIKTEQAIAKLEAEKVKFTNSENLYQRNKILFEAGNITLSKFQDTESKYRASEADFQNAQTEVDRVRAEYLDKIAKAESDLDNTMSEYYETEGDISKMKNEFANLQIRNDQYHILAPQNGYVVKAMKAGYGETITEGETICTIMPDVQDVAVEMYVRAMDVPLISKGRKVRVEFDGWPALQFSGWPNISVGTFGGTVKVIDYVNSKPGEFRILVVPDSSDEPWPVQLRVGSGIKGWVMLDNVQVWYEIWRQLNGFPPSLYRAPEPDQKEKKEKKDEKA